MHIGRAAALAHSIWQPASLPVAVYRRHSLRVRAGATWHQEGDVLSICRGAELERWRPVLTCRHLPPYICGQHPHAENGESCAGLVIGPNRRTKNRLRAASSRNRRV